MTKRIIALFILVAVLVVTGLFLIVESYNYAALANREVRVAPAASGISQIATEQNTITADNIKLPKEPQPTVGVKVAVSEMTPVEWVHGVAAEAGLSFGAVPVEVTSEGNCGEGCTFAVVVNGVATNPDLVKIQPYIIGTEYGKFVVLHELGHVNGIVDECQADAFARAHGGNPAFHDAHC